MPAILLSEVSVAFGARQVLDAVNLSLSAGDKVALAGANGSGKSTLMKVMAGVLSPDSGQVVREKGRRIAYLPQSVAFDRSTGRRSLLEEAEAAYEWADRLNAERLELEEKLGRVTADSPEADRLLARHHEVLERLAGEGYYSRRERIGQVLSGLGFAHTDLERPVGQFSGGWQMRIALARVLLEDPAVLLLDEPTNYLDLEARNWLEGYLARFRGGVLVVSHDRYFLDATVQAVAELYLGRLTLYSGNYTAYEARREQELEETAQRYRRQQEEIEHLESFIRRFRFNASKASLVQSRIRQLEKLERVEVPPAMKRIHFSFPPSPRSGRLALQAEGIGKSYGSLQVLRDLNLELDAGEKLALVGPNGAGKSTLIRVLAGEEPADRGAVRYGHNVLAGYYAQDHADRMDGSATVEETVESWAPTNLLPQVRHLLGAFLFRGDDIHKPVSVLSGGEKSRLAVLRLLLQPTNLLFLDEPTNHMDIASQDILLDALRKYTGTVVFVSHDRYFIEGLATRVLELSPSAEPVLYPGDYAYYLWRKAQAEPQAQKNGREGPARPAPKPAASPAKDPQVQADLRVQADLQVQADFQAQVGLQAQTGRQAHEAEKRLKGLLRRLEREEETVMERIDALHGETVRLQEDMGREEVYTDGERMRAVKLRLEEIEREQDELHRRWEEIDRERRQAGAEP